MKNKLFFCMILTILNIQAETYKIENIDLVDSLKNQFSFEEINSSFPESSLDEIKFSLDSRGQKTDKKLSFQAFLDDRVIGYIACDVLSDRQVVVTKWALDKDLFDVAIIKDLLFALLTKMKKIQVLRISCPVGNEELAIFFQDLGFFAIEKLSDENNLVFEFRGNSKCKLCDLLYGNIWEEEDLDDDSEMGIDVEPSELVMSDIDYN
jgi:N-acetylglutamate synthase-like GNAT family acetyltransferase